MKTIYNLLITISKPVDKAIVAIISVGMALIAVLIFIQVFARYVVGNSLSWSEEFARYIEVWVVFLTAGYALGKGMHISMDLLSHILPRRIICVLDKINAIAAIVFSVLCSIFAYQFMVSESSQLMASVRIPKNIAYAALLVGMILMVFYALQVLFKPVQEVTGE